LCASLTYSVVYLHHWH